MGKTMMTEPISKPYPNFHAARVKAPGLFLRVRVLQTTKTGVMIYGGPLKSKPRGGAVIQSVKFPKAKFTPKQAKAWLKEHKMPATAYTFEPATESKKKRWPTISSIPSDLTIKLKTYIY